MSGILLFVFFAFCTSKSEKQKTDCCSLSPCVQLLFTDYESFFFCILVFLVLGTALFLSCCGFVLFGFVSFGFFCFVFFFFCFVLLALFLNEKHKKDVFVSVGNPANGAPMFDPPNVDANLGDLLVFRFVLPGQTVTSGSNCISAKFPSPMFDSGFLAPGASFNVSVTFEAGLISGQNFPYFSRSCATTNVSIQGSVNVFQNSSNVQLVKIMVCLFLFVKKKKKMFQFERELRLGSRVGVFLSAFSPSSLAACVAVEPK